MQKSFGPLAIAMAVAISLTLVKESFSTCYDTCLGTRCYHRDPEGQLQPVTGVPVYLDIRHTVNTNTYGFGTATPLVETCTGSMNCSGRVAVPERVVRVKAQGK
jgi:hypothetical protein